MLLSIVFSDDSSLLLKFIQRGGYQGRAMAQGGCWEMHHLLAGELDPTYFFKLLFCCLLKGQWGQKLMLKDKRLLSMHVMVQGHIQIPELYRGA